MFVGHYRFPPLSERSGWKMIADAATESPTPVLTVAAISVSIALAALALPMHLCGLDIAGFARAKRQTLCDTALGNTSRNAVVFSYLGRLGDK